MPDAPVIKREPARVISAIVAVTTGAAAFLTAWGSGTDIRLAAAAGLGVFGTAIGGGEVIRSQVYSPASADNIMDAHAVIEGAERRGVA
jgi:hypothetical protein